MVVTSSLDLLLSSCSLRQIMIIKFSGAIESSHVCNLQASETMNLGNSCHQEIVKTEDNSWHWFPLSSYLCFSRVAIILIASQFLGQCPAISGMSLKQVTIQLLYSTSLGLKLYIKFSNWLISFCWNFSTKNVFLNTSEHGPRYLLEVWFIVVISSHISSPLNSCDISSL